MSEKRTWIETRRIPGGWLGEVLVDGDVVTRAEGRDQAEAERRARELHAARHQSEVERRTADRHAARRANLTLSDEPVERCGENGCEMPKGHLGSVEHEAPYRCELDGSADEDELRRRFRNASTIAAGRAAGADLVREMEALLAGSGSVEGIDLAIEVLERVQPLVERVRELEGILDGDARGQGQLRREAMVGATECAMGHWACPLTPVGELTGEGRTAEVGPSYIHDTSVPGPREDCFRSWCENQRAYAQRPNEALPEADATSRDHQLVNNLLERWRVDSAFCFMVRGQLARLLAQVRAEERAQRAADAKPSSRLVKLKPSGLYVASYPEPDVVTQGRTEVEALESLLDAVALTMKHRARVVEAGVAQTVAEGPSNVGGNRGADRASGEEQRPSKPTVPGSIPGPSLDHAEPVQDLDYVKAAESFIEEWLPGDEEIVGPLAEELNDAFTAGVRAERRRWTETTEVSEELHDLRALANAVRLARDHGGLAPANDRLRAVLDRYSRWHAYAVSADLRKDMRVICKARVLTDEDLRRLIDEARADERERCAKEVAKRGLECPIGSSGHFVAIDAARRIRALDEKSEADRG